MYIFSICDCHIYVYVSSHGRMYTTTPLFGKSEYLGYNYCNYNKCTQLYYSNNHQ